MRDRVQQEGISVQEVNGGHEILLLRPHGADFRGQREEKIIEPQGCVRQSQPETNGKGDRYHRLLPPCSL